MKVHEIQDKSKIVVKRKRSMIPSHINTSLTVHHIIFLVEIKKNCADDAKLYCIVLKVSARLQVLPSINTIFSKKSSINYPGF